MFLEQRLANPKQAHSSTGLFWIAFVKYGSAPSPPPPPDYASANRAGVIADVQTLGARKAIENAAKFGGQALQFGVEERTRDVLKSGYTTKNGVYYDPAGEVVDASQAFTGDKQTYYVQLFDEKGKRLKTPREISEQEAIIDFSGKSDIDAARALAAFQKEEGRANAQYLIDLQKEYGAQFADMARDQLRAVDPTGFALREQLGSTLQSELAAGSGLTPDEERQITQSIRGAQVARGNIYGGAPVAEEAIARYNLGEQKQQQRMANVQSYLGLNPVVNQGAQLSALGQGAAPFMQTPVPQGVNINPMAGKYGTDFALGVYEQQTRQYASQMDYASANSPLRWVTGVGQTIGGLI